MSRFTPGQRWISETEPELGLGTVLKVGHGRVQIVFTASEETRLYAAEHAPLQRVRFYAGDLITTHDNREIRVTSVTEDEGLFIYQSQEEHIPESLLSDLLSFDTAERRLFSGLFDDLASFRLRYQTLEYQYQRRLSPVSGFLGGRIDLIPHQLYIAKEVSDRMAPRVMLSDEVGLGKTIEACLILHRLLLAGRVKRVLIAVPESLVHQWFVELLRKFNVWFHIFDEERCQALEADNPGSNPFFDDQLVLCSISFLTGSSTRAVQALEAEWDLMIVDEAHHLEWSPEAPSTEYQLVEALSRRALGLLLLTATPEQLGIESHFARLRLLDPDRYTSLDAFLEESNQFRPVADALYKVLTEKNLTRKTLEPLLKQLHGSRIIPDLDLDNLPALDTNEGKSLISELLDLFGPGRVIFRNTRGVITGFPSRIAHLVPLIGDQEDHERIQQEVLADMGIVPPLPSFQLDKDPRVRWLVQLLASPEPEKILVICSTKEKALALHQAIRDEINVRAGVFHEALSLVQRDRNAAWFSEPEGARILVASEIGSEGRNFQYAHNLVLFDLPLQPELLEQRIGRLDRIGQNHDIHIHVPFVSNTSQEVLARWYHEGLNAFEKNLSAGHVLRERFARDLADLIQSSTTKNDAKLSRLLKDSRKACEQLALQLENGRDRLLELNSFRKEEATTLIDAILEEDDSPEIERYLLTAFRQYGIQAEELPNRTYILNTKYVTTDAFPVLPEGRSTYTFSRPVALAREEIGFLTWDHPVVTGAMDLVLGSEKGNCCMARWPDPDSPGLLLECIFVVETLASALSSYIPSTPVRIVMDHTMQNRTDSLPSELLDTRLVKCPPEMSFGDGAISTALLEEMMESALQVAHHQKEKLQLETGKSIDSIWNQKTRRLERLQHKHGHVRKEEIQQVRDMHENLKKSIQEARIRLDAVRLIVKM